MLALGPPRRRRRLDRWSPLEKPLALRRSKPSHVGLIQKREKQARVRSDIVTTLGLSRPLPTCRVANVVSSGRLVSRTQSEPFEGLLVPVSKRVRRRVLRLHTLPAHYTCRATPTPSVP